MDSLSIPDTPLQSEIADDLRTVVLRLADDHLILGHRLSEWCGHAPMLEEDLSLPNMALDLLGQAQALYDYVVELDVIRGNGQLERKYSCADDYAFLRSDREYVNCLMVERPNGDFAHTMARQLFFAAMMKPFWNRQKSLPITQLAAIAGKAEKEITYHLRHSAEWIIRLGDGTETSAVRAGDAIERLYPYLNELFDSDETYQRCAAAKLVPVLADVKTDWLAIITEVFAEAQLELPADDVALSGGRKGQHTEDLGYLLADLQYMQRTYPGAEW